MLILTMLRHPSPAMEMGTEKGTGSGKKALAVALYSAEVLQF